MPEYLIAFNMEWVPDLTEAELIERSRALEPLLAEMKAAGVWVYGAGLEEEFDTFSIDLVDGKPVVSDGPYVETKEHLGGFSVINVPDAAAARPWAERIAVACGWPQQVHLIMSAPEF